MFDLHFIDGNDEKRLMTDGGVDYDEFRSRVLYELPGWMDEEIDTDNFTRATEASLSTEATLTFDERLKANIINLEAYLRPSWAERMARTIDIDGREFIPNYDEATVILDVDRDEVIHGAEARAGEDSSEPAYVLGEWVYLAEKRDNLEGVSTVRSAFEKVAKRADSPDDATTDEYHGGRK